MTPPTTETADHGETGAVARTVARYADAINARDPDSLAALFADGAVLDHPVGRYEGVDAIRGFYRDVVLAGEAVVSVGRTVSQESAAGSTVVAWVSATSPLDPSAGAAHAIDVFDLDGDGRIVALEIYYR